MAITLYGVDPSIGEAEWSKLMAAQRGSSEIVDNGFAPSSKTGSPGVTVTKGDAVIAGVLFESDSSQTVSIAANNGSNPRLDLVCLQVDWSKSQSTGGTIVVVKGNNAALPVRPSLTQTPGSLWQTAIAEVTVRPGVGEIAASDLADIRPLMRIERIYRGSITAKTQPWQQPHWQEVDRIKVDDPGWRYRLVVEASLKFEYTGADNNGYGMAAIHFGGNEHNVTRCDAGCSTPAHCGSYTTGTITGPTSVSLVMQAKGSPGKNAMTVQPSYSHFSARVVPA